MKTSIFSLITVWLVMLLAACTEKVNTSSVPVVKVNIEKGREVPDTTLFENPEVVVLEANEQSCIRHITKVARLDTLIYVFDTLNDYVYVFNEQGKFLARAGRHGQGPQEYTGLFDFTVDPQQKEFIVTTREPLRLQFYSLLGEFLAETSIPHYTSEIIKAGRNVVANAFTGGYDVYAYTLDKHQVIEVDTLDVQPIKYNNFVTPSGTCMTLSGDTLFYTRRFDPTLYIIEDNKMVPYVTFDFGPYKTTDENEVPSEDVALRMSKTVCMPNNVRARGDRLLMNAYPYGLFTYNRMTGETVHYGAAIHSTLKIPQNERVTLSFKQMTPLWSEDPSIVAFTVETDYLKLIAEQAEGLDPALKEKLSALDDDSNPVLFFYRMR